jgi:hypothetical protein
MTDAKLGMQHGRLGFEARYPNNLQYMAAFCAGEAWLLRELEKDRPYDTMTPGGTDDRHADAADAC